MHVSALRRPAVRAATLAGAVLAVGLFTAGSAGATTYSWSVPLSGNDIIASGLPGDPNATGSASITGDDVANQMCGTFTWSSNVQAPVAFGHIHQGEYGKPENPAVTIQFFANPLGASSGVSGCTIVPGPVIDQLARFPQEFEVVIHNKQYPWGVLRGQLGSGTINVHALICQLDSALCPGP